MCPFEPCQAEWNFSSTFYKIFIIHTFLSIFSSCNFPALSLTVILKHPEVGVLLFGAYFSHYMLFQHLAPHLLYNRSLFKLVKKLAQKTLSLYWSPCLLHVMSIQPILFDEIHMSPWCDKIHRLNPETFFLMKPIQYYRNFIGIIARWSVWKNNAWVINEFQQLLPTLLTLRQSIWCKLVLFVYNLNIFQPSTPV